MDKISISNINFDSLKILKLCDKRANIYRNDGTIYKIFPSEYLTERIGDLDIENKIFDCDKYVYGNGIVKPNSLIYDLDDVFCGYSMPFINGMDFTSHLKESYDLSFINSLFKKLEEIVKSNNDIVFPDLLSYSNILIDTNLNIKLIDYDGMQVGRWLSSSISGWFSRREKFLQTKYEGTPLYRRANQVFRFNKNLDIKSIIYLYCYCVFNYSLCSCESYNQSLMKFNFEDFYKRFGIDCTDLIDKINLLNFSEDDNCYLGDTLDYITDNYKLVKFDDKGSKLKRLVRK